MKEEFIGFTKESGRIRVDMINAYMYEMSKSKYKICESLRQTTNHLLRAILCPEPKY